MKRNRILITAGLLIAGAVGAFASAKSIEAIQYKYFVDGNEVFVNLEIDCQTPAPGCTYQPTPPTGPSYQLYRNLPSLGWVEVKQ